LAAPDQPGRSTGTLIRPVGYQAGRGLSTARRMSRWTGKGCSPRVWGAGRAPGARARPASALRPRERRSSATPRRHHGATMTHANRHRGVRLGGRSGPPPWAMRGLLGRGATAPAPAPSTPACVSSVAAAARDDGGGGSCRLHRTGGRGGPRREPAPGGRQLIRRLNRGTGLGNGAQIGRVCAAPDPPI
jgi:hypothetical protein